MPFYIHRNFP